MKFKHFSDVYSNLLDLLMGSIALRQSRQDSFVFISLRQHLADTRAEKQPAAAACWEPKMSYKQHNTWPSETDNLWTVTPRNDWIRRGWTRCVRLNKLACKQTFWRSCNMGTTDKFFIKKLSDHTEIYTHSPTVHARTHTYTQALQCTLTPYPRSSDFKRNKEIKQNELQTHQASHAL